MFSFGVLLCEMYICEMPDPGRRKEQVRLVKSHSLRNLARECLRTDPAKRPDMALIIQEIETFKGSNSCESRVIRGKQHHWLEMTAEFLRHQ